MQYKSIVNVSEKAETGDACKITEPKLRNKYNRSRKTNNATESLPYN